MKTLTFAPTSRRSFMWACRLMPLGLALSASGCSVHLGDWGDAPFQDTRVTQLAAVAGKPVDVTTRNGSVAIKAAQEGEVKITAKVKCRSEERLKAFRVLAEREGDGTLRIKAVWPDDKAQSGEGCSFEITTPDANGVTAHTSNGSISLHGLAGPAVLESSNASVTVNEHAGTVKIETSNGSISLDGIDGGVDAQTSNASVKCHDVLGAVRVDTSNGSVDVIMASDATGPVNIESSNATVSLTVSPAFKGTLSLDTSNASVTLPSDLGTVVSKSRNAAKLKVGDGPESGVSTSNGSIQVKKLPGK